MAIGAGFAQTILMRILFSVAGGTLRRRLPVLQVRCVTAFATDARMGAPEREVRGLVIEIFSIQPDYVLVPALMIGMTMLAFASPYVTTFAMEAGFGIDVCCDLFMARQTKANL